MRKTARDPRLEATPERRQERVQPSDEDGKHQQLRSLHPQGVIAPRTDRANYALRADDQEQLRFGAAVLFHTQVLVANGLVVVTMKPVPMSAATQVVCAETRAPGMPVQVPV